MGHAVERVGGATEELGGKAIFRVGSLLHSGRVQAGGRALQQRGRALRESANEADRDERQRAVQARIDEVFGIEE